MNLNSFLSAESTQEKILVIFPGALGDFICFLPTLQKLAEDRKADLLARSEYADLVLENVMTRSVECYEISRLFAPEAEQDKTLRGFFGSYAAVYSWMASSVSQFVRQLAELCNNKAFTFRFRPSRTRMHMIDYYLSCVGEPPKQKIVPVIAPRSDTVSWAERFWKQNSLAGKRVLAISPGSGAREKNWPIDRYIFVAEWWERSIGGRSLMILGPVEKEKLEPSSVWRNGLVVEDLQLRQLAALLSRSDFYLGNDSGVTHLAAAIGVSTFALFGPSDAVQWEPRGRQVTVISQNMPCSPCTNPVMKRCLHHSCLKTLSARAVMTMLERAWEAASRDRMTAPA